MFQRKITWCCFLISLFFPGFVLTVAAQNTNASQSRSIRNWARCDGKTDDAAKVAAAFDAAKNSAFTLVVDCPVFIHIGTDIRRPIFIDDGTKVEFTKGGQFTVDNVFVPAFVIANAANIRLTSWRILYQGGLPSDPNVGGYYDNGVFIKKPNGYAQPSFAFNDGAITQWLTAHKGIHFTGASSPWAGPTNTSSVFYIIGRARDVTIQNFSISVPSNAKGSQFIPMVFSFTVGYNSNQSVTRQTPLIAQYCSGPSNFTFSNITFDVYYMGWQGRIQNTTFQHVRAYRYGDLEGVDGGKVGGVGKWFAPPHLFYLNYDPKSGIVNQNIRITDVIDYGQRVGTARDLGATDSHSGYANSLKIGAIDSVVDGYTSYRPDGLLDLLTSSNLTISNITGTYDSSFLNDQYPGIRFVQPPYQHVTLENVTLTDKAPATKQLPIWGTRDASSNQIVIKNVKVNLNNWAKAAPLRATPNVRAAANVAPSVGAKDFSNLCPPFGGTNNSVDIQVTTPGHVQKCGQP
ncbi:hypothetical protein [Alloacidobacterium sp.]|uniref:hypothetical protein n=1 Tax=Alloacidobacterium sp. TaxID=2951999 RepID=UPI002D4F770D|nr:hypothetical protein [Alloacidobacterium sp.]HYK34994.1 hypothetical protein [Alloacidobacterium sp.]